MRLGIDTSSLLETRKAGGRYFVNGQEVEPLAYLHDHNGVDILRLRLWVDPHDEEGRPYGGGTCDLQTFLALAKEGVEKGYAILLDFHYSDFWCDPAKQFIPKAWRGLDLPHLVEKLGEYTRETLKTVKEAGIPLYAIQIGNEITNGMLWPVGHLEGGENGAKRTNYDALCALLSRGIKEAKAICPEAKIVIHLERSFDQNVYREYFDELLAHHVEFDVIGMSYYPEWHGSFDMVFSNVDLMKKTYGKPIWIVEFAYPFTEEIAYEESKGAPAVEYSYPLPYPCNQQGQADYIAELIRLGSLHGVEALFYWEPLWLPCPGLTWATKVGEAYTGETDKPCANEWAAKGLFDFQGEATKALWVYSK